MYIREVSSSTSRDTGRPNSSPGSVQTLPGMQFDGIQDVLMLMLTYGRLLMLTYGRMLMLTYGLLSATMYYREVSSSTSRDTGRPNSSPGSVQTLPGMQFMVRTYAYAYLWTHAYSYLWENAYDYLWVLVS